MIVFIGLFITIKYVKMYLIKTIEVIMKLNEAISSRIRELLNQNNMSQYKLEQLSGLTHNTMLCIMNGRYQSCNLKTLMKIINALNITVSDFFACDKFNLENLIID
ncbi:MAG: helix-turn-helix transcriptional regulator [Clostridiales bacterium]|nr:helix-turn-helix transcriptional regulator [Clostridiales bacterium]